MVRGSLHILALCALSATAAEPPPIVVISQPLQRATADYEFRARIDPIDPVEVRAPMTGDIGKVHVKVGTEVKKGDVLLEMDPGPVQYRLRFAEFRVQQLEADLKARQAAFDEATRLSKSVEAKELERQHQAELAKVQEPLERTYKSARDLLPSLLMLADRQEVQRLFDPFDRCARLAAARQKAKVDALLDEELSRLRQAIAQALAYVQMRNREGPPQQLVKAELSPADALTMAVTSASAGKFVGELQSLQALLERIHVLSRARSQPGLDVLAAERDVVEKSLSNYRGDVATARKQLEQLQVVAPIAGKVMALDVQPGKHVEAALESVDRLCAIGRDDVVKVSFDVDDGTILRLEDLIREGRIQLTKKEDIALVLRLPKEKDYQHPGTVVDVDRQGDPKSGNVHVVARFPNPDGKLTPQAVASEKEKKDVRVHFTLGDPRQVLLVPEMAVGGESQPGNRPVKRYVLVVNKENVVERREVRTGPLVEGLRVIEHGLTANDWVVVRVGATKTDPDKLDLRPEDFAADIRELRLKPGTVVNPIKAPIKIDR